MKIKLYMFFLICFLSSKAQDSKIDSTNYFNFYDESAHLYDSDVKSFSLTETMVIDIVCDEMKKLGFKWISKFRIIKLDGDNYIISICYSDKSNCGFLLDHTYLTTHNQEDRNLKSLNKKNSNYDYAEKVVSIDGSYKFLNIKEVPKNLHILKMNDYWYQQSSNKKKNRKLVSKEFIIELLKNDVRTFLKDFKP
jgi:hypothetical protein